MPDRFSYSSSRLEAILANMVKSALAWDELHGQQSEEVPKVEVLTKIPRRIHCPSPDKR